MSWSKDFVQSMGYSPLEEMPKGDNLGYKAYGDEGIVVAKIAIDSRGHSDLCFERDRLERNQDLDWVPRMYLFRDYLPGTEEGERILSGFRREGHVINNPAILIKSFLPGIPLERTPGKKLNPSQYQAVLSQVKTLHGRIDAGLDIGARNVLVQSQRKATLFDLGPSRHKRTFGAHRRDDLKKLDDLKK